MAIDIPNVADAASRDQAGPDSVDLNIISAGIAGDGVISGISVTEDSPASLTVDYAAGTFIIGDSLVTIGSGSVTATAADATLPRFDLVVVNGAGTVSIVAGTALAQNRVFPAIPATSIALAALDIQAGATTIPTARIIDKRAIVKAPVLRDGTTPLTANWAVGGFDITGIGLVSVQNMELPEGGEIRSAPRGDALIKSGLLGGGPFAQHFVEIHHSSFGGPGLVASFLNTGLKVEDRLGVNQAASTAARIGVTEDGALAGLAILNQYTFASTQSGNLGDVIGIPSLQAFEVSGQHDMSGFDMETFAIFNIRLQLRGLAASDITSMFPFFITPTIQSSVGSVNSYATIRSKPILQSLMGTARHFWADAPDGLFVPKVGSGTMVAFDVADIGFANYANVFGLRIADITLGGTIRPISQEGTNGTNLLAAETRFSMATAGVVIGADATPAADTVLELRSTTGAFLLPRMTTVQRDAFTTPVNGMLIYNTTTNLTEAHENGVWVNV